MTQSQKSFRKLRRSYRGDPHRGMTRREEQDHGKQTRAAQDTEYSRAAQHVRASFERLEDPVAGRGGATLADCLMSGLAMFGMTYPSLLQFGSRRATR